MRTTLAADRAWTALVLRVSLGLIYGFAGMHKLFHQGVTQYAQRLSATPNFLPPAALQTSVLWASGLAIPFLQVTVAALLILGVWTRPALRAVAAIIVIQTLFLGVVGIASGGSINGPAAYIILPRAALLVLLLVLPGEADRYGLDHLFAGPRGRTTRGADTGASTVTQSLTDRVTAVFVARALFGALFFFGGIQKVFLQGPVAHAQQLFIDPYQNTILPVWGLWASGVTIPFFELILGTLALVGVWTRPAICLLGAELLFVTFGHFMNAPIYVLNQNILPRLALAVFVLYMSRDDDRLSLEHLLAGAR